MSIDLNALATWSYDAGTLRKLSAPTGEVTIDISANPALHLALSAPHWKNLGSKTVYSSNPADWVERKIKWNRVSETPPVLQIEKTIGAGDYVNFNVYLLEDSPDYSAIFTTMAEIHNSIRTGGSTPSHERAYVKNLVLLMQKAGLISEKL
jgi:hypothetical protein